MNLMEESFQNKEEKKKKKITGIILGAIILLVILIIATVAYLLYIQSTNLKLTLDGTVNEKLKNILVIEDDGTVYVPIKDVAQYFGYESYSGEYGGTSESSNKCYVQNENEVANFTLGSNKIYKLDLADQSENYEYRYSKKPVKAINGKLYATSETIEKSFNVIFQYEQEKNRIYIYTLPYLIEQYSPKALDYGYAKVSDSFVNQKAILHDMMVVQKDEEGKKGVLKTDGTVVLEPKYDDITYLEDVDNFLVKNNEKYGIISSKKETKVQIIYDKIELMDADAGLYLVQKDNKYGVMDFKGNIRIYIENDEIGVDAGKFEENGIKNKYILAGNLIPVRKDEKWGLYDKSGKQLVDFKYDSLGYIASNNKDAINLLVIPDYNVLVACEDSKYTLVNSSGEELFAAPVADDIYMTISGGKKYYYIAANNSKMDATEYLKKIGIIEQKEDSEGTTETKTNNSSSENQAKNNTDETNQANQVTENATNTDTSNQSNDTSTDSSDKE